MDPAFVDSAFSQSLIDYLPRQVRRLLLPQQQEVKLIPGGHGSSSQVSLANWENTERAMQAVARLDSLGTVRSLKPHLTAVEVGRIISVRREDIAQNTREPSLASVMAKVLPKYLRAVVASRTPGARQLLLQVAQALSARKVRLQTAQVFSGVTAVYWFGAALLPVSFPTAHGVILHALSLLSSNRLGRQGSKKTLTTRSCRIAFILGALSAAFGVSLAACIRHMDRLRQDGDWPFSTTGPLRRFQIGAA